MYLIGAGMLCSWYICIQLCICPPTHLVYLRKGICWSLLITLHTKNEYSGINVNEAHNYDCYIDMNIVA